MRRKHHKVDVQMAWMLEDLELACTLPLPKPRRLPDVAIVRPPVAKARRAA